MPIRLLFTDYRFCFAHWALLRYSWCCRRHTRVVHQQPTRGTWASSKYSFLVAYATYTFKCLFVRLKVDWWWLGGFLYESFLRHTISFSYRPRKFGQLICKFGRHVLLRYKYRSRMRARLIPLNRRTCLCQHFKWQTPQIVTRRQDYWINDEKPGYTAQCFSEINHLMLSDRSVTARSLQHQWKRCHRYHYSSLTQANY